MGVSYVDSNLMGAPERQAHDVSDFSLGARFRKALWLAQTFYAFVKDLSQGVASANEAQRKNPGKSKDVSSRKGTPEQEVPPPR
jgi:hypothetical protein